MKKSLGYRINKFLGQDLSAQKCEDIFWDRVVRIEAFGTDAVSAFAIMVTFFYSDGSKATVHPEQKGYYEIIESLDQRFPSIPADWFAEIKALSKEPFDVRRVLFSRPSDTVVS